MRARAVTPQASTKGPSILAAAGVSVAFKSDHPVINAATLMYEAAKGASYGLPRGTAIAAVTSVPAAAIGMGASVGSLAPGYDGDLVIWDRDPFAIGATPTTVLVNGEVVVSRPPAAGAPPVAPPAPATLAPTGPTACVNAGAGAGAYAITGVTLHAGDGGPPVPGATVVVTGGVVVCAGAGCAAPPGADVYAVGAGGHAMPGMIEALSHIGQFEIGSERVTHDGGVGGAGAGGASLGISCERARARGSGRCVSVYMCVGALSFTDLRAVVFLCLWCACARACVCVCFSVLLIFAVGA